LDPAVHRRVLSDILAEVTEQGLLMAGGLTVSPITGRDGNHEYLLWLSKEVQGRTMPANFRQPGPAEIAASVGTAFGHSG
jgi:hypothetical protein